MLEKHLVHLKNIPATIDGAQPAAAVAPIPAQNSAAQTVKEESSPGQSPAASMNNWQSPGQFQGVSPINPTIPNQYIQPTTPAAAFGLEPNGVQYPAPPAQVATLNAANTAARTQQQQQHHHHRRQVSDMSSAPEPSSFPKRQRMFTPANPVVVNPMQTSRIS